MAKVLDSLPPGLNKIGPGARTPQEPPSGPPQTNPGTMKGSARGSTPKALERPRSRSAGWINSPEGLDWQSRRCEEFGIAASRYFRKRDRPAGALPKPRET